jgi:hypothetical protein
MVLMLLFFALLSPLLLGPALYEATGRNWVREVMERRAGVVLLSVLGGAAVFAGIVAGFAMKRNNRAPFLPVATGLIVAYFGR